MKVRVEKLTVARGGRDVLKDFSFSIEGGQSVAVVGPNGAGKTTLLQALLGLLSARGGRIELDGRPVHTWSRRALARRVAYVPQFYEGYLGFTVRQVVEAGRYAHLSPLAPAGERDLVAVEESLKAADVSDLAGRRVGHLSGGERQKVWIASALAQEAGALWLDEPTQSLDPRHEHELIGLMRRQQDQGRTLIVVTHDLNLAVGLRCRALAIKDGRLAFDGPSEELADPLRLKEIFDTDFLVTRPDGYPGPVISLKMG